MRVGLVGVGNMGRAVAERLVETGHEVFLWNRTPAKAEGIVGTKLCASPADVADQSEVVLSILANDAAINAVYLGADGLCSGRLANRVIVEMCTTAPLTTQHLEKEVTSRGGLFLECPVGGTIGPAREGKLLGLAGGEPSAFDAARPVLADLTRRLEHLGPMGSGAAMKLAINLPLMVYWGAVGEAIGLAHGQGIDPGLAVDILADSSGAIGAAKNRLPPIRDLIQNGDPGGVSLSLSNGIKDMGLMQDLAQAHSIPSQVVSAALAKARKAADGGWSDLDTSLFGVFGQAEVKS